MRHPNSSSSLLLTLPYGKFAHGIFRSAALLKWSIEKRLPSKLKRGDDGFSLKTVPPMHIINFEKDAMWMGPSVLSNHSEEVDMRKLAAILSTVCMSVAAWAGPSAEPLAVPYEKQPSYGQSEKSVAEAFTQSQSILQFCIVGGMLTCPSSQSMGTRYTSGSAKNELVGAYGCTYLGWTVTKPTSPGYDLYYCGGNSSLPGFTMMVLVEGDFSNSYAGTITALFQP